jgi:hypothetical protein
LEHCTGATGAIVLFGIRLARGALVPERLVEEGRDQKADKGRNGCASL